MTPSTTAKVKDAYSELLQNQYRDAVVEVAKAQLKIASSTGVNSEYYQEQLKYAIARLETLEDLVAKNDTLRRENS